MWRVVRPLRPGTLGAVKTERLSEMRFAAECDLVRAMRHHQSARAVNLMRHLRDLEREMWFRGA